MAQTNPGGNVIVLDSAGYGTFTIAKSVSIIVPAGVFAGIAPGPGGNGVVIDVPGGHVRLQGLTISGNGGNVGIKVVNGAPKQARWTIRGADPMATGIAPVGLRA
jgi:hypothetical protein